jgi:hypothetical protein
LLFASGSLAMINWQVLAQAEEVPENVLITDSLLHGEPPPPPTGRLTQLRDRELRAILRGASLRVAGVQGGLGLECDGRWQGWVFGIVPWQTQGRYSIRNSQYCIEPEGGAPYRYCAKLFRDEAGKLFGDVPIIGSGLISPVEVARPDQKCR